jgi:hypothetical protein
LTARSTALAAMRAGAGTCASLGATAQNLSGECACSEELTAAANLRCLGVQLCNGGGPIGIDRGDLRTMLESRSDRFTFELCHTSMSSYFFPF